MRTIGYETVDVFTDQRFGGNPLAVIADDSGLSDAEMQAIAREFNYSETTFVGPPEDPANTARVRIFTPSSELPFAGHPNVGTAYVLAQTDRYRDLAEMRFEEKAGLVAVTLRKEAGATVGATIRAPRRLEVGLDIDPEAIAACASLPVADVEVRRHRPVAAIRDSRRHLHQQGGARDEGAGRHHGRPSGRGHAMARNLPCHRGEDPAAAR